MRKRLGVLAVVLWGMSSVFACAHERGGGSLGHDDALLQASTGRQWVGHQQSDRTFITCYGTPIAIEPHDRVIRGASCEGARSTLHANVQTAINTYASFEGLGLIRLLDAYAVGKYAIGTWTGEEKKRGKVVLVDDGEVWHVLSFGKIDEREALSRGVPRDVFALLTAPK